MRLGHWQIVILGIVGSLMWASVAFAAPNPGSGKLTYTEAIDSSGALTIEFDESSQKRFGSVDYALDGIGSATWDCGGGQLLARQLSPGVLLFGRVPDAKGHVVGTLSVPLSATGQDCASPVLRSVSYTSLTLTNVASGHVYRLDPISRTFA